MSKNRTTMGLMLAIGLALAPAVSADAAPLTPRQIYKTYGKAVVLVFATDGSAQGSAGTGSIITADGQVITNAHVIAKEGRPYKKLFVYLKPDKLKGSMKDDLTQRYKAVLVDLDHNLDLALLRIVDAPPGLPSIDFVDPDEVEIGEPVVAIGHPETGGLWTLTTGSISSVVADFQNVPGKDVFQTEASVNRGNSGGPLLNAYGQMVGINTCISRKAADGLAITDINFSLKSSVAVEWLKRRELLNLAYVKPEAEVAVVAMADAPKPAEVAPPKELKEVDGGDGKTVVIVVEPDDGEEVAGDPEFASAAESSHVVSRGLSGSKPQTGKKADPKKPEKVRTKHLTKSRPYKLDPFVEARVKEIKALENMMEDMSRAIDRKRGSTKTQKKSNSTGLW